MEKEEYMQSRVDDQIDWYNKKSMQCKWWYVRLRVVEIVAAAMIPFLSGLISQDATVFIVIVGFLGAMIAIIAAVLSLYRFQENWVEYRSTCESLKHEKYLYLTGTEPYNIAGPFTVFVQRVEFLISKENSSWSQYVKPAANNQG